MSHVSDILLTWVFPSIGCIISLLAFSSSLVEVLRVRKIRRLEELNPIPYVGILGLTSGQVIYGSYIKNWFVFWANAPGLVIGLWLTLSTIVHATPKVQNIMTGCVMALAVFYSSIALITTHLQVPDDSKAKVWGFAGAAALLSFYAAPLATLIKIIKSRDASSLDPRLAIMMFVNMVMWLSYGLAIKNPFIYVPEMIGGTLSSAGLVLLLIFPRNVSNRLREEEAQLNMQTLPEGPVNPVTDVEASHASSSSAAVPRHRGAQAQLQNQQATPQQAELVSRPSVRQSTVATAAPVTVMPS